MRLPSWYDGRRLERNPIKMSKVFIIQDNGTKDFSAAKRFGELKGLIERDVFPDDADERVSAIHAIVRKKLKEFDPLYDFVLLTGDPVALVIVGAELQRMYPDQVIAFLKYDRDERQYYQVNF